MQSQQLLDLFKREIKFIYSAAHHKNLRDFDLPEIAFIGKSNVGKSSLINAICNHAGLARISNTPGRTQQINFFNASNSLILVDLPGYGFAKVPLYLKKRWENLITHYLQANPNLKLVNILVDARRGINDNDLAIIAMLEEFERDYQIIYTKTDKISTKAIDELKELKLNCNIIFSSSKKKDGINNIKMSFKEYL
jgi:GTP-binding protein